jgi:hypothetical protein
MPPPNSQARLLLRGSAALVVLAVVWWLFLLPPFFVVFRRSAELFGAFPFGRFTCDSGSEAASENLRFCVPVDIPVPDQTSGPSTVKLAEFEVPRSGLFPFTFGLPVFWAIFWAVRPRPWVRLLAAGTALTAFAETALLLIFLKAYAHILLAQSNPFVNQTVNWLYYVGQYLAINVAPHIAPFLVALVLLKDLRSQVLGSSGKATTEKRPSDPRSRAKARRRTTRNVYRDVAESEKPADAALEP